MNRIKSRLYELFGTNPLPTEWTYYSLDEGIDWFAYNLKNAREMKKLELFQVNQIIDFGITQRLPNPSAMLFRKRK